LKFKMNFCFCFTGLTLGQMKSKGWNCDNLLILWHSWQSICCWNPFHIYKHGPSSHYVCDFWEPIHWEPAR
jgi:hypothetical protein